MFKNVDFSEHRQCDVCGAMVVNETLHEAWHLKTALEAAKLDMSKLQILTGNEHDFNTAKLQEALLIHNAQGDVVVDTGRGVDTLFNSLCKCGHGITHHVEEHGVRLSCRRTPSGVRCKCSCYQAIKANHVISKWKQATLIGLAALGACYLILFSYCAIAANY